MKAICTLYQQAPCLAQEGEQTVSTDELTGVQAASTQAPRTAVSPRKSRAA